MADVRAAAAVGWWMVRARVRADWQYRTSFVLLVTAQALSTALDLAVVAVLFTRVDHLAGWSASEVAFLYGTSACAFGIADTCVGGAEYCSVRVRSGAFDGLLIRPVGSLLQLCTEEFAFRRVGKVLQGAVVLVVALVHLELPWTWDRMVLLPVMVAAGAVIFGALFVLTASLSFWSPEMREAANAFTYGGNFLTIYPVGIYARWLRRIAALSGVAFVNYFPAVHFLGRRDRFGLPAGASFVSPLVAGALALVAAGAWRLGVRHYRSTGS